MTENYDELDFDYGDYEATENPKKAVAPEDANDYPAAWPQDDFEGLGAPGDAPRVAKEARALAKRMSDDRTYVGVGYCLKTVRGYYGVGAKYGSASQSWHAAKNKRPVTDGRDVPMGAPVYWTGGSNGYGHIAISLGGGLCYSTDWKEPGRIDIANINDITKRWGLKFEGYALEINDVIVWRPNPPVATVHLSNLYRKASNADVKRVKQALYKKGYRGIAPNSPKFGLGLKRAYAKFQRSLGYSGKDANGIPGPTSLRKLGFKVVS